MTTEPDEQQGYEGSGLGPEDHGPPNHERVQDDDLEHDGLGPHRDHHSKDSTASPRGPEEDYEGTGLGPEDHGPPDHEHVEDGDLEHDALGPHRGDNSKHSTASPDGAEKHGDA